MMTVDDLINGAYPAVDSVPIQTQGVMTSTGGKAGAQTVRTSSVGANASTNAIVTTWVILVAILVATDVLTLSIQR